MRPHPLIYYVILTTDLLALDPKMEPHITQVILNLRDKPTIPNHNRCHPGH